MRLYVYHSSFWFTCKGFFSHIFWFCLHIIIWALLYTMGQWLIFTQLHWISSHMVFSLQMGFSSHIMWHIMNHMGMIGMQCGMQLMTLGWPVVCLAVVTHNGARAVCISSPLCATHDLPITSFFTSLTAAVPTDLIVYNMEDARHGQVSWNSRE